jgi:hypothetical protein
MEGILADLRAVALGSPRLRLWTDEDGWQDERHG